MKEYSQVLVLDTNIILNDADSIFELSEKSKNLLVIPEIVLDELDSKKSGFTEIAFQSRKFGRLLDSATLVDIDRRAGSTRTLLNINHGNNVDILVVSKERYISIESDIEPKIKNDRKIIEIAQDMKTEHGEKLVFLTQDVMCRLRALSLGLQAESYDIIDDTDVILFNEFIITNNFELKTSYTVQEIIEEFCVEPFGLQLQKDGITKFYYKVSNMYQEVQDDDLKRQNIKPKNVGQKILSSLMLEPSYDLVISGSPAGSGKTAIALSAAMRLLDTNKDKYDKIVYIRKTVISDDQELGFLPGSLEEKMEGYLGPLYTNLEYIVLDKYKNRKEKLDKQEVQTQIENLMIKYGIEVMYEGHLRGTNIRNAVVIWDECQNDTISAAKLILTRIDDNSKVFAIGSVNQIDNKFVSKSSNALTFLLSKVYSDTDNVRISAMNIKKVERSRIAEWADKF